jgi:hypothetical protein
MPTIIDIAIKLSVVLTFYITVKFLSTTTYMKRKKRSRSIKNKNINESNNSNKRVMDDHAGKISSLTQKPITKKEEQEEKGKTITENFDTSQYEVMTEMKESIAISKSIKEQDEDKKKTISNAQKEGLINPEMIISATPLGNSINNAYANFPTTSPAITKEPPPNITKPKQAKEKEESGPKEYKNIKNLEGHRNGNLGNPDLYVNGMALWQRASIAWINTYNEFVRNAAKMNEYWFNLLCRPWTREQKNGSGEKIRVE